MLHLQKRTQSNDGEFSPCLGSYEEDIYDSVAFSGGNPWFLTTLAGAEYLYSIIPRIVSPMSNRGFNLSHDFFKAYMVPPDIVVFQEVLGLGNGHEEMGVRSCEGCRCEVELGAKIPIGFGFE